MHFAEFSLLNDNDDHDDYKSIHKDKNRLREEKLKADERGSERNKDEGIKKGRERWDLIL